MSAEDLKGVIHSDPEIMGGTPVFVGTRVPLQNRSIPSKVANRSKISSTDFLP